MTSVVLLGALAVGAYLLKSAAAPSKPRSTVDTMIDPSERHSPNADNARFQITNAIASGNADLIAQTANVIDTGLRMPKTAANLRAWGEMVRSGGGTRVAGYLEDEVGARRRAKVAKNASPLPDWLRFQATQSKLAGNPEHIRATAKAMRMSGYSRAADIHLQLLGE